MSNENELTPDWSTVSKIVLEVTYRDVLTLDRALEDAEEMLRTGREGLLTPSDVPTDLAVEGVYRLVKKVLRETGVEAPVRLRIRSEENEDERGRRGDRS